MTPLDEIEVYMEEHVFDQVQKSIVREIFDESPEKASAVALLITVVKAQRKEASVSAEGK